MSRLDELIAKLCPDGVEYKKLGEVATIVRGASPRPIKNFITTDADGVNWIKIGDVKPGEKYITSSAEKITLEGAKKSRKVKPGDFILSNSMSFGRPYILKIDGCIHDGWLAISDFVDNYLPDFLYHLLNSKNCQNEMKKKASFGGAVQNLNADIVRALVLPVPPLEVQREIVHILDSFTLLTAELTAELTARKKQYEYYRNQLLTPNFNVCNMQLQDIAKFTYGYTDKAKDKGDTRFIRITDIDDSGRLNPAGAKYINLSDDSQKYLLHKGDLLLARTGATYGKTLYYSTDEPAVYASFLIKISLDNSKILNRYYWHFSKSQIYWSQAERLVSKGGQQQFNTNAVGRIVVPVPPLEIQKKIVDVLDNFDTICSDLNIGLPAEIEARQKQYEYYRDLLLTFAETGSTLMTDRQTDRQS